MLLTKLHPYFDLLARTWRGSIPAPAGEPPGGWDNWLQWIFHGKMAGFLHQRVREQEIEAAFPPAVLQGLAHYRYQAVAVSERLEALAGKICEGLESRGFKAVPLKGLWLNRMVYSDPSLRRTTDVDLLVSRKALPVLESMLRQSGYRRSKSRYSPPWQVAFTGQGLTTVEAHLELTPPDENPPPAEEILARARPWGHPNEGLDAVDALLCLAINNAKDNLVVFPGNLCDIDALVRTPAMTGFWKSALERASSWKWRTGLYYNLVFAAQLYETPVPDNVLQVLKPPSWRRAAVSTALGRYRTDVLRVDNLPKGWGALFKTALIEDRGPAGYFLRRRRLLSGSRPLNEE